MLIEIKSQCSRATVQSRDLQVSAGQVRGPVWCIFPLFIPQIAGCSGAVNLNN